MSTDTPIVRFSIRHRLALWAVRAGLGRKAAVVLGVLAIVSVLATYILFTGAPPFGPDRGSVLLLLTLDVILLLVFGAIVAKRLVEVYTQRRRGLAGSRLHIRLVVLFSAVAVTPTIIVAVFSYLFLSFGMESWFSDKVRTAIEESRVVAQAYLEEHQQNLRADALEVAADINRNAYRFARTPGGLSAFIEDEVRQRGLTEALVFSETTSDVLGQSAFSATLAMEPIPPWALKKAATGEVVIVTSEAGDRVRAIVELEAIPNAMLYVGRPVDARVLNHLTATNAAATQYERLENERSSYQVKFILIFGAAALLLLLAAVWFGVNSASQISRRISGLVVAAEKVGGGDLSARTAELDENDEFGSLSRAFNLMTQQLETQQTDLVEANHQLDLRRRFTETVLSGVSAGVIGLDERGLVNLPNKSASHLLGLDLQALHGRPLAEIVPEMAPLIQDATLRPDRLIEGQIRLLVGPRAMVLLVRIASDQGQGATPGYVVTFDDITELLSAQRKAAWADVARRIAHEMKNPLTPIQLSAERLKKKYLAEIKSDPDTFVLCTDTIIRQVGDIGRMVDEFSSFARMPTPMMRRENLLELTRQGVFLQRTAHPEMQFDTDLPSVPVDVSCDSRQISQALTNLLQNAVDSIQARQVADAAAGKTAAPGRIRVRLLVESSRTVLSVEDNGKGLPKEGRENLTEPYVTTRAKGTGLGLAIVKKIMEDHAGELILDDGGIGGAGVSLAFPGGLTDLAPRRAGALNDVVNQTEVVFMAHDILIVDDEADIRMLLAGILQDEGYQTREAADSKEALARIRARQPSLVILDIWLQGSELDGIEILKIIRREAPQLPVLMISGHGTIETAVAAIKIGAYDFIEKPFKSDRLLLLVDRAIEAARLKRDYEELKLRSGADVELVGASSAMNHLRQAIEKVAPTGSRVLITGPAGSGKEVAARLLHASSRRNKGPFVVLNCATMRPERLEVELFGTEPGAEGADSPRKIGTFEQAHGGTLVLDEVADMPLETQGKIVRVLQDQVFERVGGNNRVEVDVRVVASSNRDLAAEIVAGRFREDLFYRLSVVPIKVPSLRDRRDDIPQLTRYFMGRSAQSAGVGQRELGEDAIAALQAYEWPGNVRQLKNVVDWLLIMAPGEAKDPIRADMLPAEIGSIVPTVLKWEKGGEIMSLPLRDAREVFEREYLLAQVTRFGGNISRTAAFIGMERSALHRKLKSLGVLNGDRAMKVTP